MHPALARMPVLIQACPHVISEEFPLTVLGKQPLGKQPPWLLLYSGIILCRGEPREEGEVVGGET